MTIRGGGYTIAEKSMQSLVDTAQASNTLAEEAMRKLVDVMRENVALRNGIREIADDAQDIAAADRVPELRDYAARLRKLINEI